MRSGYENEPDLTKRAYSRFHDLTRRSRPPIIEPFTRIRYEACLHEPSAKISVTVMEGFYREILLDHFEKPRRKGEISDAEIVEYLLNPLCGDEVTVYAKNGEAPSEVSFTGRGCAISQASASMMAERLSGMNKDEQRAEIERFIAMMRGGEEDESLGELVALKHVISAPNRIRCATLAWEALKNGLDKK